MPLTDALAAQLAAHIRANTDPAVQAALAIRNDDAIRDHYNALTSSDAWDETVSRRDLFEAMNITQFDALSAGKRDAWRLLMEQTGQEQQDFGRAKLRAAVRDVWSAAQADAILSACIRKATRAEMVFGGATEASGSVSALDLDVEIVLTSADVSGALNRF